MTEAVFAFDLKKLTLGGWGGLEGREPILELPGNYAIFLTVAGNFGPFIPT